MNSGRSRGGLTLIEVLVSLGMLGGIAALVFGVVGLSSEHRMIDRERLHAMEVAHRIILQWMDDPDWIRNQPKRTDFLGRSYVFEVTENILVSDTHGEGVSGRATGSVTRQDDVGIEDLVSSALRVLDVRVWPEGEGGPVGDEPAAHITRTYWLNATERGREELMRMMLDRMNDQTSEDEG